MAGSTAPTAVAHPAADPTSRLWQAPVFVLGVAALVGVWLARPLLARPDPAAALRGQMSELRRLVENPDGDPAETQRVTANVLEQKDQFPALAGEADFNLGGSLMWQAARADDARAADLWAEARKHLEAADKETVPEADRPRLQYRLGVVGYYTHDKLEGVVARIKTAIDQADDPVEGYTLLTQAYLNLPKPDLQEALAANLKLRNLPQAKEDILAPARLLGGELELRLGRPDQARKVLENLGPQATPDMTARAVRLCARSWQEENHWAEAAALWQKALADGRQRGEALYNLGVCARRQNQDADAAQFWEQCARAGGDEGQAAAASLAELRLKGPNPETALEMLVQVVDQVKPDAAEWTNPLLDRDAVVKLFQEAGKTYLESRHFDLAVRLAEPFERVAAPGEAAVLRAKACTEGARARQEEARQATTPDMKQAAEAAARDLFRQAATAYAAAAAQAPPTSEPGEYLWLSAHCSWDGQDAEQAAAQLDKVLRFEVSEEQAKQDWYMQRQGEGWFLLGEARRALKDAESANVAYRACIQYLTIYAYRARYYLAKAAVARGDVDEAKADLEQNLDLLAKDSPPDKEAQEKTLFALGDLSYTHGDYLKAVNCLGKALTAGRFAANPEATRAHYQLADSYRRLADQANLSAMMTDGAAQSTEKTQQKRQDYHTFLGNAASEFEGLAKLLDSPEGQNLLTQEERVQVPFLWADCRFDLGEYPAALAAYEALAQRYADRLEGLNALGGLVRCYSALGDTDKMQQSLTKIEQMLPKMPAPVQQQWLEWLKVARKPISAS